jgi:Sec-independent protein secretion pathway component TatC
MRKAADLVLAALCSCATPWALASGREGEQYVGVVLFIVAVALIAFVASMTAGVVVGAVKAMRSDESALKGGAFGVLRGLWYFLIVSAVATGAVSFLGFLWIVYAFVAPGLQDSP